MQDAEAFVVKAAAAKHALAAIQADVEQCRSSLKHLEELQGIFDGAKREGVDMTKQLIELRCSSTVTLCAESAHRRRHKFLKCTEVPDPLHHTDCRCQDILIK